MSDILVIDLETTGLDFETDRIVSVGIYSLQKDSYFEYDLVDEYFAEDEMLEMLRNGRIVGHNVRFDVKFLNEKYDLNLTPYLDTMVLCYLIYPYLQQYGLKYMSKMILDIPDYNENTLGLLNREGKEAKSIAETFFYFDDTNFDKKDELRDLMMKYLYKDVDNTKNILSVAVQRLTKREIEIAEMLTKLSWYSETKYLPMFIDEQKLRKAKAETESKMTSQEKYLTSKRPGLNVNSTEQLSSYLIEVEGLEIKHRTGSGGYSTNAASIADLIERYPDNKFLKEFASYKKLHHMHKSFFKPWSSTSSVNGRFELRPRFNFIGTVSGRTSCAKPNIQQIPRGIVRQMFVPIEGFDFVEVDYSQMELRIAAEVAGIKNMQKAYIEGKDLHDETTINLFGREDFDKEERGIGKTSNFALLYGMSAKTYKDFINGSTDNKKTMREAIQLRNAFFDAYPEIFPWIERVKKELFEKGYAESKFGRRYKFDRLQFMNDEHRRGEIERSGVNAMVQGFASDLLLVSLIRILEDERYGKDFFVCGTVHDSVLMYIRKGADVEDLIQSYMCEHKEVESVPLKIDFENFGDSWQ